MAAFVVIAVVVVAGVLAGFSLSVFTGASRAPRSRGRHRRRREWRS